MEILSKNSTTITDNPEISRKITRYQNIDENEIVITESKLENILLKHSEAIKSGSDWKTPLGLIIAIIIVFLTTEFNKEFLGIKPPVWQAFFTLFLVFSFYWLCTSLVSMFRHRNDNFSSLIRLIKNQDEKRQSQQKRTTNVGLKIKKATYGIEEDGKNVDVTNKLNELVKDDRLVTVANNALTEPDPAPGIVKHLDISYEFNGKTSFKQYPENESISLPEV